MEGADSEGGESTVITEEEWNKMVKELNTQYKAVKAITEDIYPDKYNGTKLDESQKTLFKAMLKLIEKMLPRFNGPIPKVKATKSQTVVLSNLKNEVPVFDPKTMSGESFLRKVQRFFRIKGISEEHWLDVVALMLKGDQELWFEWKQDTFKEWEDFHNEFLSKFDTDEMKNARRSALYTRKQKVTEPFETFAFEMGNLYVQVHPNAEEDEIASHVRDALYPEIRHELMTIYPLTMDNLIAQGKAALTSLKMMESVRGYKSSRLPPIGGVAHLKGCECSDCQTEQKEKPKTGENVEKSQASTSYANKDFQRNGNQSYSGQGGSRGGIISKSYRGGFKNGNGKPKPPSDKCYLCDKRGHIARFCPDKGKVLSVMKLLASTENLNTLSDSIQSPRKDDANGSKN